MLITIIIFQKINLYNVYLEFIDFLHLKIKSYELFQVTISKKFIFLYQMFA
jgi:hypothetical protein